MAVDTEVTELSFTGIVVDVPIPCDFKLLDATTIHVFYCDAELEATYAVDFSVALNETTYDDFELTPTASLLTKITDYIAAHPGEHNIIRVVRTLGYTSDFTETDAFLKRKIALEFDQTIMRIQQIHAESDHTRFLVDQFNFELEYVHAERLLTEAAAVDAAASAASAAANGSVNYPSRAALAAATVPGSVTYAFTAGYYQPGAGGGVYKKVLSQPSHAAKVQSANGVWFELVNEDVTPDMLGCVGDDTVNDQANMQNCIDFVYSRGSGNILLTPGKKYRIVLNGISLNNKPGVNFFFRGATIRLEQTGAAYGFRMHSNTRLLGPGNLECNVSSSVGGSQSIYHATASIGEPNGLEGAVGFPSPLTTISNIIIDGLTITNARNTGAAEGSIIQGTGGVHDITIQNCIFPDNAGASMAIGFDWGFYGSIYSFNITQSRINYDAGNAYSIHPHNLRILNNQIGHMTNAYSFGVRISGIYNVVIDGNDIQSVTAAGIQHTGGDESFEFAPTEVRLNACKNVSITNNNVHNFRNGFGITWEAFPDNVYNAANDPGNPDYPYTPLYVVDGYNVNGIVTGNRLFTFNEANAFAGIFIGYTKGLYVGHNVLYGGNFCQQGIRLQKGARNVIIEHNDISLFQAAGIYISDSTPTPTDNIIRNNNVYRCGNGGANNANILIHGAIGTMISGNIVGVQGEDMAMSGIRINSGSVSTSVIDNTVIEVKTGGAAYNNAYGNNITSIWEFRGNSYRGTQTLISGTGLLPYRRDTSVVGPNVIHAHSAISLLTSGLTPSFGEWGIGSTILNIDAATTGQIALTKCVVPGNPGTWKAISTIP